MGSPRPGLAAAQAAACNETDLGRDVLDRDHHRSIRSVAQSVAYPNWAPAWAGPDARRVVVGRPGDEPWPEHRQRAFQRVAFGGQLLNRRIDRTVWVDDRLARDG
jgi:hypothetical protein